MNLYMKYFTIQLRSVLQYKVSFFLTAIGQGLTTFFAFLSMYFLFTRFGSIKGYTFNEVLLCFIYDICINMFSPLIAILFLIPSYIFGRFGVSHYKSTGS